MVKTRDCDQMVDLQIYTKWKNCTVCMFYEKNFSKNNGKNISEQTNQSKNKSFADPSHQINVATFVLATSP